MKPTFTRSVILLSLGMAVFGGLVLFEASSLLMRRALAVGGEALRDRAASLVMAASRELDPVEFQSLGDPKDPRLLKMGQAMQLLAASQVGLSGSELTAYRRDGANQWVTLVSEEGGGMKPARPEDIALDVAKDGKLVRGPLDRSGDWVEAAAPILDAHGTQVGIAVARVPQSSLDVQEADLDTLRFWLTLLGALAGGLAAALSRLRGLRDLTSVEAPVGPLPG